MLSKVLKINNKHDMISHENESSPFSFENSFQIKDCSFLEHSQFKAWFGKIYMGEHMQYMN